MYIGDMRDLGTFKLKSLGGIPVEELQRASKGRFDPTITAFPDDNYNIPLPPTAPLYRNKVPHRLFIAMSIFFRLLCLSVEYNFDEVLHLQLPAMHARCDCRTSDICKEAGFSLENGSACGCSKVKQISLARAHPAASCACCLLIQMPDNMQDNLV